MVDNAAPSAPHHPISKVVAGIGAFFPAVFVLRFVAVFHLSRRRHASQQNLDVSAADMPPETILTTFTKAGRPGDPINMQILATAGQIGAAFASAGWYRADEIDLITSTRISVDSVLGRAYSTAPVSNLYLYGRAEDLAFERPGPNVRRRDHIRLWNSNHAGEGNRPIWIGSATHDIKVELAKTNHLPTHRIEPDVDAERDMVVSELAQTGYVVRDWHRPGFGAETHGTNGGGDPYQTDGKVAVLTLADTWTLPFSTHIRGALGARIRQSLEQLIRARLPQAGRERAARERAHRNDGGSGQHK